ncbi:MAG: hypothetical protein EOR68_12305 [Mesorhizobium sp.]|uniref:hypothetical protein n=1 Tax=Mesorhizobium sp. TaxID=1871066 RepID=UPI000FE494CF|nr:hypothetical protein [Mesorhizobium sp.]RWL83363.1 MAG: hypothetical protein EOR69_11335 [Mesorhizobium sp.]RWL90516.1 MAG: hypothetical protein EOR67_03675 [Mesorhizobium sp.]RWL99831.1 MAG: hypothetical protein EOR68_12305 [Mesorhizobium sp.]RWM00104.1 MAG: hypothetical protein EOR70_08905 [Mesorhizobium sp.]
MISISGLLHGTSALRKSQRLDEGSHGPVVESRTDWNQFAGRSVLQPVIRYLALAFIFFQVATTTALATQVVLFESDTAPIALPIEATGGAPTQPISPVVRRATEHLLIQIDSGKQLRPVAHE